MASKPKNRSRQELMLGEQAETLAMRYLLGVLNTRKDLEIVREVRYSDISDLRIDVQVKLIRMSLVHYPDLIIERKMGMEVKGLLGLRDKMQTLQFRANTEVQDKGTELVKRGQLYPFCLCVFNVRNNQGFFHWIIEPTFYGDTRQPTDGSGWAVRIGRQLGSPGLLYQPSGEVEPLDQIVFNNLIDIVDGWYEAVDNFLEQHPNG
jgi:hypothetical protein